MGNDVISALLKFMSHFITREKIAGVHFSNILCSRDIKLIHMIYKIALVKNRERNGEKKMI
jgi:hypothetical protein